jgi:hypothetical protein
MTDQSPNGSPSDLEARIAALERKSWRNTVDDSRNGMETAFWALLHALFPEEARKHLKVAGREQLLAARVYLDRWIERLDEADRERPADPPHEKIAIE